MGTALIIYVLGCTVCLFFLSFLLKFFKDVWWTPIHIQSLLRSQGIKGPSYKFYYGNSKEVEYMEKIASSNPIELSQYMLLPTVLPHIYSWNKLFGKNFLYWRGPLAQLVVTEPGLIKEILNNKDGAFSKGKPVEFVKKLLGDGLVLTRGEKWFKLRKISNQAFHAESLKGMIPAMIASVEMMLERWKCYEGKEIEVNKEFKVLTSEVISRTAFGSSYLQGQHVFDMLKQLGFIIYKNKNKVRIPGISDLVKTKDDIESDKLDQEIQNSFIKMINEREMKADGFGSDFLGLLLKAHHENDMTKKITVANLIDECKTFYIAGHETTTNSLTWIFLLLAIHQEWQDKARKEVLEIFGHQNPSPEGLARLKTVSMIINETLRLYPPAVSLRRNVERQVSLGKLNIPANVDIELPILAVHLNPQIWGEDVYQFKPERFASGVAKATNNNIAAYFPFSFGPRNCVGSDFSIIETKIAVSMILQRYRFSLSSTYIHSPITYLTLCPQHGLQIMLHRL